MFRTPALRTLLRVNALFATGTGLTAIAITGPIAQLIGVGEHRLISATGGGLLLFALGLVVASGATTPKLLPAARLISFADALWVAGTIVIVVFADLPPRGNLVLCAVAAIVASFATLQIRTSNQADRTGHNQVVELSRILDGRADDVWAVVIDHETYGQLAPNLSKVVATGPDGPDLTRRCWDTRGRHWDEACVLWDEGQRFAVVVDTAVKDYPYPLDYLRGEWAVRPIGNDKTEVTIRFELRPNPGPVGAAFATAMTTGAKPLLRRIMKGWQEIVSGTPTQPPPTSISADVH